VSKRWALYAKRPFGGPQQVLSYLANYTHRVALSNRRIVAVDAQHQTVTFTYRDYRHGCWKGKLFWRLFFHDILVTFVTCFGLLTAVVK
jgi:hypothetical protein